MDISLLTGIHHLQCQICHCLAQTERGMATHSSILAWRIPRTEELGGYSPRVAKSQTRLSDFTFTFTLGSSTQVSSVAQSWLGRRLYKGTREGIPRDGREEYGAMDPKR